MTVGIYQKRNLGSAHIHVGYSDFTVPSRIYDNIARALGADYASGSLPCNTITKIVFSVGNANLEASVFGVESESWYLLIFNFFGTIRIRDAMKFGKKAYIFLSVCKTR